jgi:hypothetical protein
MNSTAQGPMPSKRQREIYGPPKPDPTHDPDFLDRVAANNVLRMIGSLVPSAVPDGTRPVLVLTVDGGSDR